MRKLIVVLLAILLSIIASQLNVVFGQEITVLGKIVDTKNQPIAFTKITVKKIQSDSATIISGGISDESGFFKIAVSDSGQHHFQFSFLGFITKDTLINVQADTLQLGEIILWPDSKILNAVEVESNSIGAIQNGDTTTYNANAYKVNPDANAQDLVTKMPGVGVVDGEIQAGGEKVTEVLVDGKPFFGSDPNSVLKNVPAEMIDQVQIYDKKSDESQTSGIDDGNTTKTINIITKVDYKNGTFGRVYGGYGTENTYTGGFAINHFNDKHRISFIGMANNINQSNFSSEDLSGIFNSGGRGGGGGQEFAGYMNTSNFMISQKDGLSSTYATGLNYVRDWKKTELTGSFYINLVSNDSYNNLNRSYFTSDNTSTTYLQNDTSESSTYSYRFNLKLATKIDSANSFTFKPSISATQHKGLSLTNGLNYTDVFLTNNLQTIFNTEFGSMNIAAPFTFTHKFQKKKRSISFYVEGQYSFNQGNNSLFSETYDDIFLMDSTDQISGLQQRGYLIKSEISFNEPLGKNASMVFAVSQEYGQSFADKITDARNTNGNYDLTDSTLSSSYELNYLATKPTVSYKYGWEKSSLSINLAGQYSQLNGLQDFPFTDEINRDFYALLPSVQFSYRPARKKGIRINYNTRTQNPEISDLQTVIDNTNPIQLKSGNANLVQAYYHNLSMRFSTTNTQKNSNFMLSISGNSATNYIATNSVIAENDTTVNGVFLSPGMQYKFPVNLNGFYSTRAFMAYGIMLKKLKSNLHTNVSVNYSLRPSMINSVLNNTSSTNLRGTLGLSSNISEKIDFNINSSPSFTWQNTSLTSVVNTYFNLRSQFKITLNIWKGFVFETDLTNQYYNGLSSEITTNFTTLNGSIGYKFFKKKSGYLRIIGFDLLNQNSSVSRTITDVYFEDSQTNTINRYFMIEFIYKLNYFKGGDSEPSNILVPKH